MRFMMLVKHAEELSGPPPKALMDAIDKLTEEANKAGTMVTAGGLAPTQASTHVRVARGQLKTTDGPFTESKEVIGGLAILQANSKEEAIEHVKKFIRVAGDGECELRQLFEAGQDTPESQHPRIGADKAAAS